jgi:hypothetical protein
MGFLSKASDFLFGSSGPKYNMDNAAITSQYGVQSDLGNMRLEKQADGSYAKVYESSDIDKQRNALASQGLGSLSLDPSAVQQAYYNQATSLLEPRFEQQRKATDESLINRGIQTGTEQYNTVMGNLNQDQQQTLQNIANQAVYQGYDTLGSQIGNINSLTSGRDVYALSGMSGTNDAYDSKYSSDVYRDLLRRQRNSNIVQFGVESPATAFNSGVSGFFSDKRLKENLKKVGALANGLNVYIGNYKKETGLDTRPQLFLIAQEVKKKNPKAVGKRFGALTVDYKEAVKGGK